MEIQGKIIAVLEPRSGTSSHTGNTWKSQEYVIETHDQYPKKCCFRVFGEDKINQFNIQQGEELTVSVDINAREYKGRWFNDVNAWRVDRSSPQQDAAPASPQPVAESAAPLPAADDAPAGDAADDLPF